MINLLQNLLFFQLIQIQYTWKQFQEWVQQQDKSKPLILDKDIIINEDLNINLYEDFYPYKEIDLSRLTINGSTSFMFNECRRLQNLKLGKINSTNAQNMFYCCSFQEIDLSNVQIHGKTIMMFACCHKLKSLTLKNIFSTSAIFMFEQCDSLEYLDIQNIHLENSIDRLCICNKSLKHAILGYIKPTDINCIFYECKSLNCLEINDLILDKAYHGEYTFEDAFSKTNTNKIIINKPSDKLNIKDGILTFGNQKWKLPNYDPETNTFKGPLQSDHKIILKFV